MKKSKRLDLNLPEMKNKEMSPEVYALRRQAIEMIYEAKKLVPDLPRLTVRITDNHERTLGKGWMKQNVIWLSERAVTGKDFDLRTIVFHEILHACYGIQHDESCPLMRAIHKPLSKAQCERLFLKWAQRKTAKSISA